MLRDALIIMPLHLPWNWSADYQRQTALELAKNNLVIVYVDRDARFMLKPRPKKNFPVLKNVLFYQPRYVIPFIRISLIELMNKKLNILFLTIRYGFFRKKLIWIFDPVFWYFTDYSLKTFRIISLYDCVDYVWNLQEAEKKLVKGSTFFFVNSHVLFDLHKHIRIPNAIVPQGFKLSVFTHSDMPVRSFPTNKPIIGFIGSIDQRVNFDLLTKLIKNNPQWRFVLWGPAYVKSNKIKKHMSTFMSLDNVVVGKSDNYLEVPAIIKQFSVCVIPYDTSYPYVKYCFPMKLFEYFYEKKPVVSSDIMELRRFPFVLIAKTIKEWERNITKALTSPYSKATQNTQRRLAKENSWHKKISLMSKYLE